MSDELSGHSLVLAFDADGDFVRGFEAGRAWEQLKADPDDLIGQPLHATNAEMLMRMGESLDLTIAAEPQDDTWIVVRSVEENHHE